MGGKNSKSPKAAHSSEGGSRNGRGSDQTSNSVPAAVERPSQSNAVRTGGTVMTVLCENGTKKKKSSFREDRVAKLFTTYAGEGGEVIAAAGVETLCNDLEVNPTDLSVLALAWKCEVKESCAFTKEEFLRGCRALQADSLTALKAALPGLVSELNTRAAFDSLYKFTFAFGLEANESKMSAEMAVNLWTLVFSRNPPEILENWCEYCSSVPDLKISRDTWSMFLHFSRQMTMSELGGYDDNSAWPNLMDDFVETQLQKA